MGKQWKQWLTLFFWTPKSLQMVIAAMKLKDAYFVGRKVMTNLDSISLKCSCLENPVDRGAWWATVHGVAESDTTEATWHTPSHMNPSSPQQGVKFLKLLYKAPRTRGFQNGRVFSLIQEPEL